MNGDIWQATIDLIRDLGLHDGGAPVDLSPLEDIYVPRRINLRRTGLRGVTMRKPAYRPSRWATVGVVIDSSLSEAKQREIYCHEVGHHICGHEGSVLSLDVDSWFHDRAELEATEVAAMLLIPIDAWMTGDPAAVVAQRCHVHPKIAEVYPWPWKCSP